MHLMNVLCAYNQDMNGNMIVNGISIPRDYSLIEENKQVTTTTVLNMRGETQSVLRAKRRRAEERKNPQLGEKEHFLEKVTSKMKPRP